MHAHISQFRRPKTGPKRPVRLAVVRKRDRAGKQDALVRAAMDLFASRGFDRTTTREIAARAGCAEGLIHRYFQGKAGLLFALMRSYSQKLANQPNLAPRGTNLQSEIQNLLQWEVESLWDDRNFLRVAVPRAMVDPEIGRLVNRVGSARRVKVILKRLHDTQGKVASRKEKELRALAHAISALGFAFGFVRHVVFELDPRETKKLTAEIARIFSRGFQRAA